MVANLGVEGDKDFGNEKNYKGDIHHKGQGMWEQGYSPRERRKMTNIMGT